MPTYKVIYFEGAGRAELTRLALSAAKQPFEDVRLKREEWELKKESTPQKMLPILEVDGQVICQSGAMVRCVAREHGLYGKTNMESTEVDVVLETIEDIVKDVIKVHYEKDQEKKSEDMKTFSDTTLPRFVTIFCNTLCANGGGDGWMVGSSLSIADLAIFSIFDGIKGFLGDDALKAYTENKKLAAHCKRVKEIPEIKAWLEKRPPIKAS